MNRLSRSALTFALAAATAVAVAQTPGRLSENASLRSAVAAHAGASLALDGGAPTATAQTAQNEPPVKDDLFAGVEQFAKNAIDATEVTMDPDSLDMVKGPERARAHRMVLNVVRTYRYDKPGMYNMADVDVYRNKLNTGDWHCSVHVRKMKTGQTTDVCERRRTDGLLEHAIITVEPQALTFIHQIRREDGPGPGHSSLGVMPFGFAGALPLIADLDLPEMMDLPLELEGLQGLDVPPMVHPFAPGQMKKFQLRDRKIFKFALPEDGDAKPPTPEGAKPGPEKPKE